MKIGIELNGVLRDTVGKFKQVYEKLVDEQTELEPIHQYESTVGDEEFHEIFGGNNGDFKYEIKSDVTSLNFMDHFSFKSSDDLYTFMYDEYVMSIFGHAGSPEFSTFHDLHDFYIKHRDKNEVLIVSDEIGKSKPASLFFISKFGCQIEKVKFYSHTTLNSMWDEVDVLLTANPDLLLNYPQNKIVVKYETEYNKHVSSPYTISSLKEFDLMLENILKTI
jgi:hypothetical protein